MNDTLKAFVKSYLETAEWADLPEEDMEKNNKGFSLSAVKRAIKDCSDFIKDVKASFHKRTANAILNKKHQDTPCIAGHDFWLTRNRHGAGFWDGDYPEKQGEILTNISHRFKQVDVCLGEDNFIHFI